MRLIVLCVLGVLTLAPSGLGETIVREDPSPRINRKMWWVSAAALTAAALVDARSSVGKYESNPLLRSLNGTFDPRRGLGIKLGLIGTALGTQYFLYRKNPDFPRSAWIVNFAAAGALGGIAARNSGIPKTVVPATPMAPSY